MAAKKGVKRRSVKKIDCCVACHSPHLTHTLINGESHYVCLRCGYAGVLRERKSAQQLRLKHQRRELSTHQMHGRRSYHKRSALQRHTEFFHLRMWFHLLSIMLMVTGFVLLLSSEWTTGVIFLAVGAVGFTHGRRL